jgi:hypothetical protein
LMKEELYFKKSNLEVKRQKTLLKGSWIRARVFYLGNCRIVGIGIQNFISNSACAQIY